jgi:hypothetical protein
MPLHGFQVQEVGRISPAFRRGLKLLHARGFADDSCTIVKTTLGRQSGITHEGGRYVHSGNPYSAAIIEEMKVGGIAPPPLPFVVAPGPMILFHEWGHHVDIVWSQSDPDVPFSFRWFSHLYQLAYRAPGGLGAPDADNSTDGSQLTMLHAADLVPQWKLVASELFANLFEDWMREPKRCAWDACDPALLDHRSNDSACSVRLDLFPGVSVELIRRRSYALFEHGLHPGPKSPTVRPEFLGPQTAELVVMLRTAMARVRKDVTSA